MKFYIRRAIAGIVAIPFVAGAWCFFYLLLLLAGAEPNQSLTETFNNGVLIGSVVALFFTFAPQVSRLLDKLTGTQN
jgi:hypothetical protein